MVIGAGIAGLSAADHLLNRYGFKNVTILEAQDRIGGRIHPIPFGIFSYYALFAYFVSVLHGHLSAKSEILGLSACFNRTIGLGSCFVINVSESNS